MNEKERQCQKCKKLKPLDDFPKNRSCTNGRERTCRFCGPRERNKKWRKNRGHKHTSKVRRKALLKTYKLSPETYDNISKIQNNVCKICRKPETRKNWYTKQPRKLAVDHNHKTEEFRGLLCSDCNNALGFVGDNIETLKQMICYINKNGDI